jgi:P-type Na+/K+ transporter
LLVSSLSPFYPRGDIRSVPTPGLPSTPTLDAEKRDGSLSPEQIAELDPENDYDDMTAEEIVRVGDLEANFEELVRSAALNNMATIWRGEEGKGWEANGDPTEVALQVFAHKAGLGKPHL